MARFNRVAGHVVKHSIGLCERQTTCQFGNNFRIDSGAKVTVVRPGPRSTPTGALANPSSAPPLASLESLVVRMDFDNRAELLAADPDVYYLPDHYVGYTAVLVRLSRVSAATLRDLRGMAYKFVTRKAVPGVSARKRR